MVSKEYRNDLYRLEVEGYAEKIKDIKYACANVYEQIHEVRKHDLLYIHEEVILVADEITPTFMSMIDHRYIKGMISKYAKFMRLYFKI